MLKIRRSHDRLIFNMEIPIPEKDGLYIEMAPRSSSHKYKDGLSSYRDFYYKDKMAVRLSYLHNKNP